MLAAETHSRGSSSTAPALRPDMGVSNAPRSVEQGADTIVWLATLPATGLTGGFFADRKQNEW